MRAYSYYFMHIQYAATYIHSSNYWSGLFLQTVKEYVYKICTCSGNYSCSQITCKLSLPTMDKVAMRLKRKYEQSLYSMIIPSSAKQHVLVVDRVNQQRVHPGEMIYFSCSPDYCTANPIYSISGIAGRECILNDSSLSHHCDKLCCDHGYETHSYRSRIEKRCECTFIWCCRVECKVCYETEIKLRHICRNKQLATELEPDHEGVSSTSYINI